MECVSQPIYLKAAFLGMFSRPPTAQPRKQRKKQSTHADSFSPLCWDTIDFPDSNVMLLGVGSDHLGIAALQLGLVHFEAGPKGKFYISTQ